MSSSCDHVRCHGTILFMPRATQQASGLRGTERVCPQARVSTKLSERMLSERVAAQVKRRSKLRAIGCPEGQSPELRDNGLAVLSVAPFREEASLRQSGHA